MNILIRPEQPEDITAIYQIHMLAFGQENESKLVNKLRHTQGYIPLLSLVALSDGKIVGHILFTRIYIISPSGKKHETLALAPVAVHPQVQQSGIGGQLIQRGLSDAKILGYQSAIVLGHEQYYPKYGFLPADRWHIQAPFDVPSAAFMAIELCANALNNISGTVEYPKEFSEVN